MKKKLFLIALATTTMLTLSGCTAVDYLPSFKAQPAYMNALTPMPVIIWSDYEWDWGGNDINLINEYNYLVMDYNEILDNPQYNPQQIDILRQRMMKIYEKINNEWKNIPERREFLNAFNQRMEYHYVEMGGDHPKGFEKFNGRQLREFHKVTGGFLGLPETESQGNFREGFSYPGFALPPRDLSPVAAK